MDAKPVGDSIASIRKALEEFLTPSLRELRAESHADVVELKEDIEKLKVDVQQLRAQASQEAALGRSEAQQFREETAASFSQVRAEARQFREETATNFSQVRSEIADVRSELTMLRSVTELGFAAIGAKLDVQADVQRLKEQVAALQGSQPVRALESGRS